MPLTSFLCVYVKPNIQIDLAAATRVLNDERTLASLPLVAKSYGAGALKAEPRGLERLPISYEVLYENGLAEAAQPKLL